MEDKDFIFLQTLYTGLKNLSDEGTLDIGVLSTVDRTMDEVAYLTFKHRGILFQSFKDLSSPIDKNLSGNELVSYLCQYFSYAKGMVMTLHSYELSKLDYLFSLLNYEYLEALTKKH